MAGPPPPGPGDYEVLAQGEDEPPRRLPPWLGWAAAAAVVVLLLTQTDGLPGPADDEPAAQPSPQAVGSPRVPGAGMPGVAAAVPPSLPQLAGVWLVDKGPPSFSPGRMWMAFHTDGTFRLDDRGALLSKTPWVRGHFHLHGAELVLVVEGGTGCRPGDRFYWRVGALPGNRLLTEHVSDSGGLCRVEPGVWVARALQDRDMVKVSWKG